MRGQGERKRKEEKPVGGRLVGVVAAVGNCMKSHWPFQRAGAESLLWLLSWDAPMSVCVCVCVYMHACGLTLSYVDSSWPPRLYVAQQAPLSMGFCRQEYWSGLACPPLGDLPNPGIELAYPALAGRFLTTSATWEALIRRSLRLNEDIKEPWNDLPGILIRKERDSSEFALCQMRTQEKVAIYTPGEGSHQEPWSWTSHRTMGSKCLLCKPLHLWYCVTAAGADQDTTVLLQVIMKGWVPGIWMAEVPQVTPAQVSREPAL